MTTSDTTPASPAALLAVRGLGKRFSGTPALLGIDLTIRERETLAVVGPSGAGKSALCSIIAGLHRYDDGTMIYRGYPINLRNRRDAIRIGIAFLPQRVTLVPALSVYDNIVLPAPVRSLAGDPADLRKRVGGVLDALDANAPPLDRRADQLSEAEARLVGLARALIARAKLYVFDDPFAALAAREIDGLVGLMGRLRLSGCGLLVTGRDLGDLLPIADRVSVIGEGRTVFTGAVRDAEARAQLDRFARGDRERAPARPPPPRPGLPALAAIRLAASPALVEATFSVAAGTILALHGQHGAGGTALLQGLAGLRRRDGTITVAGVQLPPEAAAARRAGVAIAGVSYPLPLPRASARHNLRLLARHGDAATWPIGEIWRALALPDHAMDGPVEAQPAGIRRRIAIAGALLGGGTVVLLDDPTFGLAPQERQAVHASVRTAAARGRAIILSSSDRDEVLALADRCLVLRAGRLVGDFPCALLDAEALRLLACPAEALARSTAVLTDLIRENGGAAFWALLRDGHVVCLDAVVADARADPGLGRARAMPVADTRIPAALAGPPSTEFVIEPDGARATVLVPIRTRRGGPHGWIGLTLGPGERPPPAAAVAFRVETLAGSM